MTRDPLLLAWAALVALSLAGTGLAMWSPGSALGPLALLLGFFKGRIILHRYLGLARARRWRRGFDLVLAAFCTLLAALSLLL